jgi:hypothetical protein
VQWACNAIIGKSINVKTTFSSKVFKKSNQIFKNNKEIGSLVNVHMKTGGLPIATAKNSTNSPD